MRSTGFSTAALAIFTLLGGNRAFAQPPGSVQEVKPAMISPPAHNFARWEKEIAAYEAADRKNPPKKGGVLFIGSSTIRLWKTLAEDFPSVNVINRGFGGSEIVDS